MRRPPATIVILAWNAWEATHECLEALRPTLGVRDQVVVVDNGSTDATPRRLTRYPWIEVVTNPENRGFAAGSNQGAEAARHDLLVFLNNDTVPCGKWLDALLAPFEDPAVVAVGPRSNFVAGHQAAEGAAYPARDRRAMRQFARQWAHEHRGQVSDAGVLVGFCLAVRRPAFAALGGFDEGYGLGGFEDDDLCQRLRAEGGRLVVAHESFVHHEGHQTFEANGVDWYELQQVNQMRFEERFGPIANAPFVSACLIVKDEAQNLPTCLASLEGFADEVVVYDTGSTDDTVAVARQLGATVIEGYWDDDFSRARNAALAACQGQWVAWLDADETLVCENIAGLRKALFDLPSDVDGLSVPIDNLTGSGVTSVFVHSACRLFRRARCEWAGRLHEQVAMRGDHRPVATRPVAGTRLRHTGYLDRVMTDRNKVERNLRVAHAEVDNADGWEKGFSLISLGRSYLTAGRPEEAARYCREGAELTNNAVSRRLAVRTVVEASLALGRFEEAESALADLRTMCRSTILPDSLQAKIALARGEYQQVLDLLSGLGTGGCDDDGFEYDAATFAARRAQALVGLERFGEAADVLLAVLGEQGVLDAHLGTVVDYLRRAGRPLSALADAIPEERRALFLAQVLQLQPDVVDEVLEASWDRIDTRAVLATARAAAVRLPVERQLVWSARLRQHDLADLCPLVDLARDAGRRPSQRIQAAAAAFGAFGDQRARAALGEAAAELVGGAQREAARAAVSMLAPALLADFDAAEPPPAPAGARDGAGTSARGGYQVSVVVVVRDDVDRTIECLERIAEVTAPSDFEVVVVDNGSTDATAELCAGLQGDVQVVRIDERVGAAAACNRGAAVATGRVLVFVGTAVDVRTGWLRPLLEALDEDGVGIAGPKVLRADGTLAAAGLRVVEDPGPEGPALRAIRRGFGTAGESPADAGSAADIGSPAERETVEAVGLSGLAVRRDLFEEVGGFDEGYWHELAAVDLALRLGALDLRTAYEPASQIVQHELAADVTDASRRLDDGVRFAAAWSGSVRTPERSTGSADLPDAGSDQGSSRPAAEGSSRPAADPPGAGSGQGPTRADAGPPDPGPGGVPDEGPALTPYYGYERPEVVAMVPDDARRVLDLGCAAGRLGAAVKRRQQCHVTGVEVNHAAAAAARAVLDDVVVTDLNREPLRIESGSLDCVICADVLEHLADPWAAVSSAHDALAPGGAIVVSIPNIRNLGVLAEIVDQGTFEYRDAGILDRTHLRFFTRRTFTQLLEEAGFGIELVRAVRDPAVSVDLSTFASGPRTISAGRISIDRVTEDEAAELSTVQFLFRARKAPEAAGIAGPPEAAELGGLVADPAAGTLPRSA